MVRVAQFLALYFEILSDPYRPGFTPWAGRSADEVAGYTRTNVNRVPPVPDSLLSPLLANSLNLLDTISPHLVLEAQVVRAADQHEAASRRGLLIGEIPTMRDAIEHRRTTNVPAPLISTSGLEMRLKDGWDPCDPLVKMAWNPVVLQVASAMGHRRNLETLRLELEQWVQKCGIQAPWCRNPVEVPRQDTGELVPWTQPMSRNQLDTTLYSVVSAAFAVTSALSGMRSSELAELSAGCARREEQHGGAIRFRLVTRGIKGEAFGGTEDAWVVIEDMHRAISAAGALTGAAEGARLFATASNNSTARFRYESGSAERPGSGSGSSPSRTGR